MFGSWGKASKDNHTIQLRSLDWDLTGPFWKFPAITVYHLNGTLGGTWANFGILGFMGVFSGINEKQMAVSEIGVTFSDETFGNESRFGNPFTYMLRDILQFDNNLDEAIKRLVDGHRTCNLLFGVGDGKKGFETFRGFQLSHDVCNVYNDSNL